MQREQCTGESEKSAYAKEVARVGIIDTETGELLDKGKLVYVPRKMRIKGFFMANQIGFETLAKSGLTSESFRVLMLLMSRMDYENAILVNQKDIAETLVMKKQNVSRAMRSLRTAGVFESEENRVVYLATELGWKGKVQNLHKRNAAMFTEAMERTSPTNDYANAIDVKIDTLSKVRDGSIHQGTYFVSGPKGIPQNTRINQSDRTIAKQGGGRNGGCGERTLSEPEAQAGQKSGGFLAAVTNGTQRKALKGRIAK